MSYYLEQLLIPPHLALYHEDREGLIEAVKVTI
jgi:hypothetical protein